MTLTLINPNLHLNLKLGAAEHRACLALNQCETAFLKGVL